MDGSGIQPDQGHSNSNDDDLEVEEVSDGDIRYDADLEVRHPDEYEEAGESPDFDSEASSMALGSDVENHLSAGMQRLYCDVRNGEQMHPPKEKCKKRGSKDISRSRERTGRLLTLSSVGGDLEITELQSEQNNGPLRKRRKAANRRRSVLDHTRGQPRARSRSLTPLEVAILSEQHTPTSPYSNQADEEDAMELG